MKLTSSLRWVIAIVIAALPTFAPCPGTAQSEARTPLLPRGAFSRAELYTTALARVTIRDVIVEPHALRGRVTGDSTARSYPVDDLLAVRVVDGTQMRTYAGIGALSFGLGALVAVLTVGRDHGNEPGYANTSLAFVLAATAAGTGLGALVGSARPRWRTLYSQPASLRDAADSNR
ncbi:MAG: hypothetical protein ACRENP_01305 [Longimicrobiales bacterium]